MLLHWLVVILCTPLITAMIDVIGDAPSRSESVFVTENHQNAELVLVER